MPESTPIRVILICAAAGVVLAFVIIGSGAYWPDRASREPQNTTTGVARPDASNVPGAPSQRQGNPRQ